MIMSDLLDYGTVGLFGVEFEQRYQTTIDNLFMQILSLSEDDTGKTAQNVEMFSQYKPILPSRCFLLTAAEEPITFQNLFL